MISMWRPVVGWKNYEVSKSGTVRNTKNKHIMSQHPNGSGYNRVSLSGNGVNKQVAVHKIVWESFIGKIDDQKVIDHIDNNRLNNRLDNLQLLTKGENIKKGKDVLKKTRKSFTSLQKRDIQNDINKGLSIRAIAKLHPISWQWVAMIKKEGKWKDYGTTNL